jgi:hypothetical protein
MKVTIIYNYFPTGKKNEVEVGRINGTKCEALPRVGDFVQLGKLAKGKWGEVNYVVEDVSFIYVPRYRTLMPFIEITQAGYQDGAK